jgi:hypothetical protein
VTSPAEVTAGYRRTLIAQRATTGQAVTAGLAQVDLDLAPDRLAVELARWSSAAAAFTTAGQASAGRLSLTYLSAFLSASAVTDPLPPVDPLARVGVVPRSVPGESMTEAMHRAGIAVLWRLRSAPRGQAVRYGQYAATRVVWTSLQDSATTVLHSVIRDHPRIRRWRRVTSATACSFCSDAAAGSQPSSAPLDDLHPSCRCTQEPQVS